jgi:cytochrome b
MRKMTDESAAGVAQASNILVWDAPVRVFHWLMVLCFAGAYLTAESEKWRLVHVILGYTLGGLVAFRLVWGIMGTRYARFASFLTSPAAVLRYVRSMFSHQPEHHVGHNPAGAVAIVLLLLLSVAIVASGWAVYNDVGGHWLETLHEGATNAMLLVVAVHVAGVAVASSLHRENLVRAMLTGKKEGAPKQGIQRTWVWLAGVIIVVVMGFWWFQWQTAPSNTAVSQNVTISTLTRGFA